MYDWIIDSHSNTGSIITANRHLARLLRKEFADKKKLNNQKLRVAKLGFLFSYFFGDGLNAQTGVLKTGPVHFVKFAQSRFS